MTGITLTHDQQNALDSFVHFLTDPTETVFVLEGYSGTGKTTLIKTLLDQLPKIFSTVRLINPKAKRYNVELTATTNKAAEAFQQITGNAVKTIHSHLGLRVETDYQTQNTRLVPSKAAPKEGELLFIDEASYIDRQLMDWIFRLTNNCKIVFMGDPAQLTPVKSNGTPVFDAPFKKAQLSQVVRQAKGNPIIDLSTKFRETVNSGEFFQFKPDGFHIQHMDRDTFNQKVLEEFTRPNWEYSDSKILAWTNKRAIEYNHYIRDQLNGTPHFNAGDYAVCNQYFTQNRKSIKTDSIVCITEITPAVEYGVSGNTVILDNHITAFLPDSLSDKKARIKQAQAEEDYSTLKYLNEFWIDLRAAYACTINKSQGSTYDRVFIDLDDVSRCNSGNQIARLLYVGVSRARHHVFLTGDFG